MVLSQVHIGIFMGIEDPLAYAKPVSLQFTGVVTPDSANKREGNTVKLAANNLDPKTIGVLLANKTERSPSEDVFAVTGASAPGVIYPNQEKETGSLHRGNLEKILSERALIDAGVDAPDEYGHGSIEIV